MRFPKANSAPRHVLLKLVEHGDMNVDEIIAHGISTETKQRNRVLRVIQSLLAAECIYAVNYKYRATPDAVAYAEDLLEIADKKPTLDVVGPPYQRPFHLAPELKGYTKSLYQNKCGYD